MSEQHPHTKRKINNNDLDDDDDNGSKAEDGDYEDVRYFDEENDLGIIKQTRESKPTTLSTIPIIQSSSAAAAGSSSSTQAKGIPERSKDDWQTLVDKIVSIPWPAAAGKRPPRDMKRLDSKQWYIVCKVMKWGDTPALFLRGANNSDNDFGFYKPPERFYAYQFQVGDRIQVTQVGYSSSRNKVATGIQVQVTHMFPVSDSKRDWVAPPITDSSSGAVTVEPKKKREKQYDDGEGSPKKKSNKKSKEPNHLLVQQQHHHQQQQHQQQQHHHQRQQHQQHHQQHMMSHSPQVPFTLGSRTQQQMKQQQQQSSKDPTPLFLNQAINSGLPQNQGGFFPTSSPEMNRNHSFSLFPSDLFGSTNNLFPPSSPNLLGSSSPLVGGNNGPPSIARITSAVGGFGSFPSISSPSTNHPQFSSFSFPSMIFNPDPSHELNPR